MSEDEIDIVEIERTIVARTAESDGLTLDILADGWGELTDTADEGQEIRAPLATWEQIARGLLGVQRLTRREHFAAAALTGLLANSAVDQSLFVTGDDDREDYAAESALKYADALIARLDR